MKSLKKVLVLLVLIGVLAITFYYVLSSDKRGLELSETRYNYPSGEVQRMDYSDNKGLVKSVHFNNEGNIIHTTHWLDEKVPVERMYGEDGKIRSLFTSYNYFAEGLAVIFDENGDVIRVFENKDGIEQKVWWTSTSTNTTLPDRPSDPMEKSPTSNKPKTE
ncbi:MAG: hypothetical protein HQL32_11430 [Planctomycetes bacterium]|nr:hypothetical protein [Planctomycetota bacterium]